jgi:LacI family gluconate utilization system Gnt-I transcriptional repressor
MSVRKSVNKRPTLRDIAEIARVSEMTASRVLRGKGEAAEYTKERVLNAARELGYVPNKIAGALSSQTVNLVAVVVPSISSFVFSQVLTGVSDALVPAGLNPVFGLTNYDLDSEEQVIKDMLSWRPAGLILAGLEHTDTARRMLLASGIPVVEIMDTDGEAIDMNVGISHHAAGYEMARTILAKGHKRIGFIGTKMPLDFRASKRFDGFMAGLQEAEIELVDQELYPGASSIALGRQLTAQLLDRTADVDCIYYSSDMMSAGGLMHCIANDISVPNELALAGFNGLELLDGLPKTIATSSAHRYDIGLAAGKLIIDGIQDRAANQGRTIKFDAEIRLGDTL